MKLFAMLLMAATMFAEAKPAKLAVKTESKVAVPPGATQIDANTYQHTDAKGVKWIYKKTPWGVAKIEDKPGAKIESDGTSKPTPWGVAKIDDKPAAGRIESGTSKPKGPAIAVFEEGEMLRFERPGPFGMYKWKKKKDDLTEEERDAWDRTKRAKQE